MDKLRETISQHSKWYPCNTYIDRIEAHIETDFSISIENGKALLETICKEICKEHGIMLDATSSVNAVLKKGFTALGYSSESMVAQISTSLSTIGSKIGELRNEIGTTSHGKTLEEIKERNEKIDLMTREFLIDSIVIVAVFLIKNFEFKKRYAVKSCI